MGVPLKTGLIYSEIRKMAAELGIDLDLGHWRLIRGAEDVMLSFWAREASENLKKKSAERKAAEGPDLGPAPDPRERPQRRRMTAPTRDDG